MGERVVTKRTIFPPQDASLVHDVTDLLKMAALTVVFSRVSNVDLKIFFLETNYTTDQLKQQKKIYI